MPVLQSAHKALSNLGVIYFRNDSKRVFCVRISGYVDVECLAVFRDGEDGVVCSCILLGQHHFGSVRMKDGYGRLRIDVGTRRSSIEVGSKTGTWLGLERREEEAIMLLG